ncbi:MAG: M1 family aminopeptidase [Desulfobacterales bacterium]|jgi:hypothetical protein
MLNAFRQTKLKPHPILWALVVMTLALTVKVNAFEAVHQLEVQLDPLRQRLVGVDRIAVGSEAPSTLRIFLGPDVVVDHLKVNGAAAAYVRHPNGIVIETLVDGEPRARRLEIHYHGRFDDTAPSDPVNTDNPGYGVTATISPQGSLLLPGAGWYPSLDGARERLRIEVVGPPGTRSVTAGRPVEAAPRPGFSVSAWQIDNPAERLALVAGDFTVRTQQDGHLQAATYLLNDDPALADQYLQASLNYLAGYETLFGPYPFEKFAVVESFFPTGYGFPSYTLIGGRVLRLPFIIRTSLGHEIAHCWWGNGVLIDFKGGNWSEGLTTYVSDYRYQEQTSAAAARNYRLQMLRNYTELVPVEKDFPLARFSSRRDPLTKAVGYDKATMVFHMLRQRVGDAVFWATLRTIAEERMFQATSWEDIRTHFEAACRCKLDTFFHQWVRRPGAPQLVLEGLQRTPTATGSVVRGIIRQKTPVFELEVPVRLAAGKSFHTEKIIIRGTQTPFEIETGFMPQRIEADPQADLLRRLDAREIPPTINRLKTAQDLLIILPDGGSGEGARQTATRLGRALGLANVEMITRADWQTDLGRDRNILFMQPEKSAHLSSHANQKLAIAEDAFRFGNATFDRRDHTFVGVFPHPQRADRFVAVYYFGRPQDRLRVATKVPHYGKYSYLIFEETANVEKGTWPVTQSPLIHVWAQDQAG